MSRQPRAPGLGPPPAGPTVEAALARLRAVGIAGGAVYREADGVFRPVAGSPLHAELSAAVAPAALALASGRVDVDGRAYLVLRDGAEVTGLAELEADVPLDDPTAGLAASLLALALARASAPRIERELVESGKVAALGQLAAGVAHEINNPLLAILGLVEFLLADAEPGSKAHERLTLIRQSGVEIKEIVRALLDFAREPTDKMAPVSLDRVVAETLELVRRTTVARDVEIVQAAGATGLEVDGSRNLLKQVLLHLVTNAQEAMTRGGTITVAVERERGSAAVTVSDTGPGIPAEVLPRVFEPFYTTRRGEGGPASGSPWRSASRGCTAAS